MFYADRKLEKKTKCDKKMSGAHGFQSLVHMGRR